MRSVMRRKARAVRMKSGLSLLMMLGVEVFEDFFEVGFGAAEIAVVCPGEFVIIGAGHVFDGLL